jgi:hypothetical protein
MIWMTIYQWIQNVWKASPVSGVKLCLSTVENSKTPPAVPMAGRKDVQNLTTRRANRVIARAHGAFVWQTRHKCRRSIWKPNLVRALIQIRPAQNMSRSDSQKVSLSWSDVCRYDIRNRD